MLVKAPLYIYMVDQNGGTSFGVFLAGRCENNDIMLRNTYLKGLKA